MKNSLLKNSIFKALLSICNIIIPLIIGPYITHLMDVDLYGAFNKVIAELNVFIVIASFGIYNYGVKEISKIRNDEEKVKKLFSSLFVISLISNIVVCILYIFYSLFTSKGITLTIYLTMIIQFIANMFYVEFVNEALENYNFITKKTLIVRILYLFSIFIFVKKPSDIIIYSIIYSGVVLVNNLVSYIYIRKEIKLDLKSIEIKKHIKPLFLIFLIGSVEILYFQLDKVMLGKFISDISVSVYQIPYMIMSMIITIPTAVVSVSIPRLSNILVEKGKKAYEEKLNSIFSYFVILLFPVCLGVFSLSEEIILLYAGEKYIESAALLKIFSVARILIGFETFMTLLVIYINNHEKQLLYIFGLIGLVNFIVNLVLVALNVFNPFTAALTTAILYFILILLEYIYIKRNLDIKLNLFKKNNIVYFILSILFVLISFVFHKLFQNIFVVIFGVMLMCVILYAVTLIVIKDKIVINTLLNVKNKIRGGR